MADLKITYNDKIALKSSGLADENSWNDVDANEVKEVVNSLRDRVVDLESGNISEMINVSAVWVSGLSFYCTALSFPVNGEYYKATSATVTADAADATLFRRDLIVAKKPTLPATVGTIEILKGDLASESVVIPPDYDPSEYFVIKDILIKPASTTPSKPDGTDLSFVTVFAENAGTPTEFAFSSNSANIVVDTNDAHSGTYSIEGSNVVIGNRLTLTYSSTKNTDDIGKLSFWFKNKASLGSSYIFVKFLNSGSQVGSSYLFNNGKNGLVGSSLDWQNIIIDKSVLNLPSAEYNAIQIYPYKSYLGFYLDDIEIITGGEDTAIIYQGIEEAPLDGKEYNRKNGQWVEDLGGSTDPNSDTITTSTNITNATLTDGGYSQEGKVIGISNGVNAINYTVNSGITASFVLLGTGAVTFVQGSGRTLEDMNGTLVLNGEVGSTASIVSIGTVDYLYINNL